MKADGWSVQHWWVNHRPGYRQQIEDGYLWSPKTNKGGARNVFYDNMTRALPGDVVYSCAEGSIGALGLVVERVRSAPAPEHAAERAPAAMGWLLPVRFEPLARALLLKEHMGELAPRLPKKHSPLRATGFGNRSVYLTEVDPALAALLAELLGGQRQSIEAEIAIQTDERLIDLALEEQIWRRSDLRPREKRELISARAGQGLFRENVERLEKKCRVTGVLDRRHLRASHIKPWRVSDDREKLDGCNGLLLSPHIEHLFERGHISFADGGRLLVSSRLNPLVIRAWGLERARPPRPFGSGQRAYLDFHRQQVFEKASAGRRT
jgi:HNH endonuclease